MIHDALRSRLRLMAPLFGAALVALSACEEDTPSSLDPNPIPVRTVEVELPWSQFGQAVETYTGYGKPSDLGRLVVARDFDGALDAHALILPSSYPLTAIVRDSTGTNRIDSAFVFLGGRLVGVVDTLDAALPTEPIELEAGLLPRRWDAASASWLAAVDSLGRRETWPEPGAGPVQVITRTTWDPESGDSIFWPLDSAQVAAIGSVDSVPTGVRIDMVTPGGRVTLRDVTLKLDTRPGLNPDTLVSLDVVTVGKTFIYSPDPSQIEAAESAATFRVGGVPAWRTVLRVDVPRVLTGPEALCAAVGCPFTLTQTALNNARLLLTTDAVVSGFRPTDSLYVDTRTVLAPELLPKAPLSASLTGGLGISVPPSAFEGEGGVTIEVPVTSFVRDLLSDSAATASRTSLALLTTFEPLSVGFGMFRLPGMPGEPRLRLILTVADTVVLP